MKATSSVKYKNDFPLNVTCVSFTKQSTEWLQKQQPTKKRIIIVGGNNGSDTDSQFYEILINDKTSELLYKPFAKNCDETFSSLKHAGLSGGKFVHSYLIGQNRYIVIFKYMI